MQQLFCRNRGDLVLPTKVLESNGSVATALRRVYASAARDETREAIIVKLVNPSAEKTGVLVQLGGVLDSPREVSATVVSGNNLADENSLREPKKIAPISTVLGKQGSSFRYELKPYSLTVLRVEGP